MYLCLKCYQVYGDNIKFDKKLDWNFCPKSNCNGNTIEIDELFIPIIIELNKKGYKTTYSCSGHIYDSHINSYIGFEGDIKLNSLPNGYVYDKIGISCIRKVFDSKKDMIELSKDIYQNAINVLEWVDGLEKL